MTEFTAKEKLVIAIDFDGTCVSHEFPKIGNDIGALPVLKALIKSGHQLILYTMRSDGQGENNDKQYLTDSIQYLNSNGIFLYGVQTNPTQEAWTSSPKCFAHLYIDDAALGCPLKEDKSISLRPFVDWVKVSEMLIQKGLINPLFLMFDKSERK